MTSHFVEVYDNTAACEHTDCAQLLCVCPLLTFLVVVLGCTCHGHSDDCVFDQTRFDAFGSGGVCQNCRDNTEGQHCDRCAAGYYVPGDRTIDRSDACVGR